MLRHLVNVNVEKVKAAARQSAADLGYSSLKTSTREGSCPVCNRPWCIRSTSNCCHTCCGKLIAFLQNKLGYWSVTRPFVLAKGRQCQTTLEVDWHLMCIKFKQIHVNAYKPDWLCIRFTLRCLCERAFKPSMPTSPASHGSVVYHSNLFDIKH